MVQNKKKTPWDYYREGTENPTEKTTPESVKLLNQYYGSAQAGLDENRRLAQEKNNVAYQTAQKYLPIQTKMNGLSGLGVGQSASVDLYNKYATRQGAIDASHASESNDLFKNYLTERNTAQKEYEQKIYDDAVAIIEEGKYNNITELEKYLNSIKGKVSDAQWNSLTQLLNYEAFNPLRAQERYENDILARQLGEAGVPGFENYGKDAKATGTNDEFSVTIEGESFTDLKRGAEETNETLGSLAKDIENGHVFSYDGKVYLKEGDKIYVVDATDETLQKMLGKTYELKDNPWYLNPWLNYLR